jgi:calcineurin-like phosphoesterase family protein
MFFRSESIEQIKSALKQLNGHKILIKGNHDGFTQQLNYKEYFDKVCDYLKIRDGDREVVLFHYPIEEWDGFYRGSYHLYGHVHNSTNNPLKPIKNRYNVGVDVNNFEPKTLNELISTMNK